MVCPWIFGILKIFANNAVKLEEIANLEIYRLTFISQQQAFVLLVTSVVTESVEVKHCAVGARIMHGFGTDLIRNAAFWLVESRNQIN